MIAPLCVCALAPHWRNRVRVVIVQDQQERCKTTNTGRLVPLALAQTALVAASDLAAAELAGHSQPHLLFPGAGGRALASITCDEAREMTLVVPDANWPRAQRLAARHPFLRGLPRLALPAGPPTQFRLRQAPRPDQVSTLEAVARALGVLEAPDIQQALDHWFRVFVDRTRWTRGELPASEVTGGIPEAAFSFRGTRRKSRRDLPTATSHASSSDA